MKKINFGWTLLVVLLASWVIQGPTKTMLAVLALLAALVVGVVLFVTLSALLSWLEALKYPKLTEQALLDYIQSRGVLRPGDMTDRFGHWQAGGGYVLLIQLERKGLIARHPNPFGTGACYTLSEATPTHQHEDTDIRHG